MQQALRAFAGTIRGYVSDEALLLGVETRTSSPVRVPRDPELDVFEGTAFDLRRPTRLGDTIDRPELAPHDLRRTFAKLAQRGNARLEDISMTLGHARLTTTQIYLGLDLNLENDSAPDRVGMLGGRRVVKL